MNKVSLKQLGAVINSSQAKKLGIKLQTSRQVISGEIHEPGVRKKIVSLTQGGDVLCLHNGTPTPTPLQATGKGAINKIAAMLNNGKIGEGTVILPKARITALIQFFNPLKPDELQLSQQIKSTLTGK